jgi:hypothetical protein
MPDQHPPGGEDLVQPSLPGAQAEITIVGTSA